MTHTFTDALALVLKEEGGFVHDPNDYGGMTNLGVTAHTWEAWTSKPATEAIMRALTPDIVAPMYRHNFWDAVCGEQLGAPAALLMFDFGVNAGPARAAKLLQGIVGGARDGLIGPVTLRAVQAYVASVGMAKLIANYAEARRDYYRGLDRFIRFGGGWLARVARMEKAALSWVG
jgi:lysozyme family protein